MRTASVHSPPTHHATLNLTVFPRSTARLGSLTILLLLPLAATRPAAAPSRAALAARCTVFTVSEADRVLFGGNDDYIEPDSYYWVDAGDEEHYGAIWIGRPDNVQQGVNERGLAYDANGLPRVDVKPHPERRAVPGGYTSYPIHILRECATVEEVLAWVEVHRWHSFMHDQMHFADATGDAVILSAGADGELAITRKPAGDGFLVSTNFNVANPSNGFAYPCWRYARAQEMLGNLLNREAPLTVEDAASVLDAVHVAGVGGWTIESMVADLTRGRVYLYYFHQFDRPIMLDVREEIADPRAPGPLSELFPEDVREEAASRYESIQARTRFCRWLGQLWLLAVLGGSIVVVALVIRTGRGSRFWIPAATVLGPVGVLARLLAGSPREGGRTRSALIEAVGDVMATAPVFVVFLVLLLRVPALQGAWWAQLALVLGLPPLLGWSAFHGPLLAATNRENAGRFFFRRLSHAWVAANLGMAGTSVLAMPLVNRSLHDCPVEPLSVWTLMTWWALVALSAIPGVAVLFVYEHWAVARGFRAWSVLAGYEGTPGTPPLRRSWWWIPVSYAMLVAGVAAAMMVQGLLSG